MVAEKQAPALSAYKQRVATFYDELSPHFRALWGEHLHDGFYEYGDETKVEAQEKLVAYLARFAGLESGARGLDIGCGMGASSIWLSKHLSARMTGLTLSATQVGIACELALREHLKVEFLQVDAEQYQPAEPFDFAWMLGVLGHFENQRGFIHNAGRFVRPGGRFVLTDWVAAPQLSEKDRLRYVEPTLEGMLMPDIATLDEYTAWFNVSGFRVLETRDLTAQTLKTWDHGISILQGPEILRMASQVGPQALSLMAAVRNMRTAMGKGFIRYGILVAEKL